MKLVRCAPLRDWRGYREEPWALFRELQEAMGELMSDSASELSSGYPPLNIQSTDEGAAVTVDLPGVKREDVDISVTGNTLTLKAKREAGYKNGDDRVLRRERSFGSWSRTVQLGFDIEADKVDAILADGVLEIKLPRRKEEQPRRIEIAAAAV